MQLERQLLPRVQVHQAVQVMLWTWDHMLYSTHTVVLPPIQVMSEGLHGGLQSIADQCCVCEYVAGFDLRCVCETRHTCVGLISVMARFRGHHQ